MAKYSFQNSIDSWDWERVPLDVDAVVFRWAAMLHDRLPWRGMPPDDAFGYIRAVVSEILNEARHPGNGMRERRLSAAARAHGEFRRRQQHQCTALSEELAALRSAIEASLVQAGQSPGLVRDYLVLLDADVESARASALVGWNTGLESVSFRSRLEMD